MFHFHKGYTCSFLRNKIFFFLAKVIEMNIVTLQNKLRIILQITIKNKIISPNLKILPQNITLFRM